jgi:hypothetical protein
MTKENIEKGWELISQFLELDPPQPLNLYLGCIHEKKSVMIDGAAVDVMVYNMEGFLKSSLELYRNVFPTAASMATTSSMKVQTPCTPEDHQQAPAAVVNSEAEIADFASGAFPAEDKPKEFNTPAARVIMNVMYVARMARLTCYALSRSWRGTSRSGRTTWISVCTDLWSTYIIRWRTVCMPGMIRTLQMDRTHCGYTMTQTSQGARRPRDQPPVGCISYQRWINDTTFVLVEETELCFPFTPRGGDCCYGFHDSTSCFAASPDCG